MWQRRHRSRQRRAVPAAGSAVRATALATAFSGIEYQLSWEMPIVELDDFLAFGSHIFPGAEMNRV
jgi:S-adenosylmethionine:diacylglycerol 3-amino-3-carboxypropyl transferase